MPATDKISVYCALERVGFYKDEQAAIEAAIEYSRDTERSVTIEYPDESYSYTDQRRDGEWILKGIFRPMAAVVAGTASQEAAE